MAGILLRTNGKTNLFLCRAKWNKFQVGFFFLWIVPTFLILHCSVESWRKHKATLAKWFHNTLSSSPVHGEDNVCWLLLCFKKFLKKKLSVHNAANPRYFPKRFGKKSPSNLIILKFTHINHRSRMTLTSAHMPLIYFNLP